MSDTTPAAETAIEFRHVDIVFGKDPHKALELLDNGKSRDEILAQTNNVIGVADADGYVTEWMNEVGRGVPGYATPKVAVGAAVSRLNQAQGYAP